jgi:hypothetical protein
MQNNLRGDIYAFDLFNELNKKEADYKWRLFNTLKAEKSHKKAIFDISNFKNTIITMSLDRLV